MRVLLTILALLALPTSASAGQVTVAVAANFLTTAQALAEGFEAGGRHEVRLAHGATGTLTAQITRGAPFDIFLAADQARPAVLAAEDLVAAGPSTYAEGRLAVAFRGDPVPFGEITRMAIADPQVAPYGAAALEALAGLGISPELVRGENVAQAMSFVVTGNAEAGIVARSMVLNPRFRGSFANIHASLHAPVRQDAVLLLRGAENPAARAFYTYLFSAEARRIIINAGYGPGIGGQE
ncbi:molybdate ABC transporter substrate-binding protein [Alphaproteobacteria bacterium KMM 3653]|uniref:Molybdate ABC transporter substrate-binding protein n=1 Tax=Harenicola maris TaxID=2841044 RepID=A0AAP2CQS7_9RHOB|nr:molybdate ABC transporter substrate-binding protein [Harenicola maris]